MTIAARHDRSTPADTFVIVAAYNEADRIGATLDALAQAFPGAPLWVADDGSTDRTPEIAHDAGARVVRSERLIGKGAAMTAAARDALAHAFGEPQSGLRDAPRDASVPMAAEPVFLLCDGDLGSSASELGPLVDAVHRGEADLAVGAFARRVGGGVGLAVGFARWAIHTCSGVAAAAPISGQRALSARALQDALPFADGFGMEIGMTIDVLRAGHRLSEIELDLEHRASTRTLAGFVHRGGQLVDFVRAYVSRRFVI